jgi:hypothetical protein
MGLRAVASLDVFNLFNVNTLTAPATPTRRPRGSRLERRRLADEGLGAFDS